MLSGKEISVLFRSVYYSHKQQKQEEQRCRLPMSFVPWGATEQVGTWTTFDAACGMARVHAETEHFHNCRYHLEKEAESLTPHRNSECEERVCHFNFWKIRWRWDMALSQRFTSIPCSVSWKDHRGVCQDVDQISCGEVSPMWFMWGRARSPANSRAIC